MLFLSNKQVNGCVTRPISILHRQVNSEIHKHEGADMKDADKKFLSRKHSQLILFYIFSGSIHL